MMTHFSSLMLINNMFPEVFGVLDAVPTSLLCSQHQGISTTSNKGTGCHSLPLANCSTGSFGELDLASAGMLIIPRHNCIPVLT